MKTKASAPWQKANEYHAQKHNRRLRRKIAFGMLCVVLASLVWYHILPSEEVKYVAGCCLAALVWAYERFRFKKKRMKCEPFKNN